MLLSVNLGYLMICYDVFYQDNGNLQGRMVSFFLRVLSG